MEYEDYAMLLGLAGIWGASFLFIKLAVGEMSPVFLVFGRCLAAAVGLAIALPPGAYPDGGPAPALERRAW